METIGVGLAGFGCVGYGTYAVLRENADLIESRLASRFEIRRVLCRDVKKARDKAPEARFDVTTDWHELIDDPTIAVVVEVIGGIGVAKELIVAALKAKKNVVTANKYLIATCGEELFRLAEANGVRIFYEASVAGGIPIIKTLREGICANRIRSVIGIVNGTSNFILSEMRERGDSFETVLRRAQRLGYAEADPSFDIDGIDAAHKMTILATLCFGVPLRFDPVVIEGIRSLDARDMALAEKLGFVIKLVGKTRREGKALEVSVLPRLVAKDSVLSSINGSTNALVVDCEGLGETVYIGKGAGERPTASAVVADLMDVARGDRAPMNGFANRIEVAVKILTRDEFVSRYYVRCARDEASEFVAAVKRLGLTIEDRTNDDLYDAFVVGACSYQVMAAIAGALSHEVKFLAIL